MVDFVAFIAAFSSNEIGRVGWFLSRWYFLTCATFVTRLNRLAHHHEPVSCQKDWCTIIKVKVTRGAGGGVITKVTFKCSI